VLRLAQGDPHAALAPVLHGAPWNARSTSPNPTAR
jgi:hypothetical protein